MTTETLGAFGTVAPAVEAALETALSSNPKALVAGLGMYLEMPNISNTTTTQILITPAGIATNGTQVPITMTMRTVADWSPRKQWRVNRIRENSATEIKTSEEKSLYYTEQIEVMIQRHMKWSGVETLRKQPIVFELIPADLDDILNWKAPASALRRIQKARLSLTFPEKLLK